MGVGVVVGGVLIGVIGGLVVLFVVFVFVGLIGILFLVIIGGIMMMVILLGVGGVGLVGFCVKNWLWGIEYFEFNEVNIIVKEVGVIIFFLYVIICCLGL